MNNRDHDPPRPSLIPDADVIETRRYEDFSTIDWVEEAARDNHLNVLKAQQNHLNQTHRMSELHRKFNLDIVANWYSAAEGWVVLALIGVTIGLIAAMINLITEWLADIKTGRCTLGFYLNREFCCSGYETCAEWKPWATFSAINYLIYVTISTIFAFISAFLVYSFAPYAAGSGISEIKCIVAGFIMKGYLGAKTLAIKSIGLPFAIASGLSVGKEGPSVHYATCVGNSIASQLRKYRLHSSKMREILSACTAAGVAVAFGSPMGGVLFSVEEISSRVQLKTLWRTYFCALIAVGSLAAANPFRDGKLVLFSVRFDNNWKYFETIYFIILGILGGFYGIVVSKWNLRVQAFRKKYLAKYAVEEATTLAFITAVICYFNSFLRIDMTESMQVLFSECETKMDNYLCRSRDRAQLLFSILIAVVTRSLLVILSYGSKVPAGIFVPSMAVGALFGRFVGTVAKATQERFPTWAIFSQCPPEGDCIVPGAYAFLGAGAALSGIMNLTVTVVVIMFELTGALRYILPTMIVVGTTKLVSEKWGKGGVADQAITFNGYPFIDNKEELKQNVPVSMAMSKNVVTLAEKDLTVRQLLNVIDSNVHHSYPVLDDDKYLVGYVNRDSLKEILDEAMTNQPERYVDFGAETVIEDGLGSLKLQRVVHNSFVTVGSKEMLDSVIDIFVNIGPRIVYVQNNDEFCGLLTRKDVLRYKFKSEHIYSPKDTSRAEEVDRIIWESMKKLGSKLQSALQTLRTWRS